MLRLNFYNLNIFCLWMFPLGKAAWATRAVSSGTGGIGSGCKDIDDYCWDFLFRISNHSM